MDDQGIRGRIPVIFALIDIALCTIVYGATISDYFIFRFYEKKHFARKQFMTARDKNRFYAAMNNVETRGKIQNKDIFNEKYAKYLKRNSIAIPDCGEDAFASFLNIHKTVFIKPIATGGGEGILKLATNTVEDAGMLFKELSNKGKYVAEAGIVQHPQMAALHPESVNSLRISTYFDGETVRILFALLRCGTGDCYMDNHMMGGIVMIVDTETGKVASLASCKKELNLVKHPNTGIFLPGFQIPHWEKVVDMIEQVARSVHDIRYIGWDVAILDDDVCLIEANPSGDFNLFQEPMQKGCKAEMNNYIKDVRRK